MHEKKLLGTGEEWRSELTHARMMQGAVIHALRSGTKAKKPHLVVSASLKVEGMEFADFDDGAEAIFERATAAHIDRTSGLSGATIRVTAVRAGVIVEFAI